MARKTETDDDMSKWNGTFYCGRSVYDREQNVLECQH